MHKTNNPRSRPRACGVALYSLTVRVRVMLPEQHNPCTDCKSAKQCTTRGIPYHSPSYIRIRAVVWAYGRGQTYIQTDTSDHYTFRVVYDSHEM